jgi:phosphoribosylaminoimidazole (AIR) synthetase
MTDDKKHSPHKRQYAVLSRQTVKTFAEIAGHGADMPDDIASVLAEDVSYRIREIAQVIFVQLNS